jgi:adenosylhomocysteinase
VPGDTATGDTRSDAEADSEDPLAWTRHTPLSNSLADEFGATGPFAGLTVAVASHLEPKTGVFVETLHAADHRVKHSFESSESPLYTTPTFEV